MAAFTLPKFTFAESMIGAFATDNSFTSPFTIYHMAIIKDRKKEVVSIFRHNLFLIVLVLSALLRAIPAPPLCHTADLLLRD